jgi:hypothetical protein
MTHNKMQTIKILLSVGVGKLPRVTSAPTSPGLTLCAISSFVLEGADTSTMPWHSFSVKVQLFTSRSPAREPSWRSSWMSSHFPDVAALLGLGSLCCCCILVLPYVSSWTSILSGFTVQHRSYLRPDDHVPCAMQEWHGGSSLCGRQPTSSMTHHSTGSISSAVGSALWLDACPHTASSVFHSFHWGLFFRDFLMLHHGI